MPDIVLRYSRDDLQETLQYGCVVEMWDNVVGRGASGNKRRKYHAEFTAKERKVISRWHTQYHRWYLVTGPPDQVFFRNVSTVHLLQRAAGFFATV